jgi:hypothetical protein
MPSEKRAAGSKLSHSIKLIEKSLEKKNTPMSIDFKAFAESSKKLLRPHIWDSQPPRKKSRVAGLRSRKSLEIRMQTHCRPHSAPVDVTLISHCAIN